MTPAAAPGHVPHIGFGHVWHTRLRPTHHRFIVPTFFLMLPMRTLRAHPPSAGVLVVAQTNRDELAAQGFKNLVPWSRGVDTDLFHPNRRKDDRGPFKGMNYPRPALWLAVVYHETRGTPNEGLMAVHREVLGILRDLKDHKPAAATEQAWFNQAA